MLFQDVHQLSSVSLRRGHFSQNLVAAEVRQLPFPIAQLHALALHLDNMMYEPMQMFPRGEFAELPNLCQLELAFRLLDEQSMLLAGSFLRSSPCLRALVLKYIIDDGWSKKKMLVLTFGGLLAVTRSGEKHKQLVKRCKYKCLKEVEFLGWDGRKSDSELLAHLIEDAAGSLERVTLDNSGDPFLSLNLDGRC